jgi:hypothetical protein
VANETTRRPRQDRPQYAFQVCAALSNLAVVIFERTDNLPPRWPTFRVKLSARQSLAQATWDPNADNIQFAKSLLGTMESAPE